MIQPSAQLHSCTFVVLVTELLCALDFSSDATAFGSSVLKTRRQVSLSICRQQKKAKTHTIRELSRKTPDSIGTKLLIACTALRTPRNRHLGTLMRSLCFEPLPPPPSPPKKKCQSEGGAGADNNEGEVTAEHKFIHFHPMTTFIQ